MKTTHHSRKRNFAQKTLVSVAVAAALTGYVATVQAQTYVNATASSVQTIAAPAIRGQVVSPNGQFLQGAIIRLMGTNRETTTDRQGRFRFDGLTAGTYEVSVDYLGFANQTVAATVTANAGQEFIFELEALAVERIQVVGSRDAQARALNAQRSADNIKSVVSSDFLGRFPDANVAESMQRLPGASIQRDQGEGRYVNVRGAPLEYANVSIDGVVLPSPDGGSRAVDLDTIPSDVIAALELTKAVTPDMDADAIAGNINIVTQGALDAPGRIMRGSLALGRNEKGNGDSHRVAATFGDRIGDSNNLGFLVSVSDSETNRVTDNVETVWFENDDGVFLPEENEFKDYEVKRSRTGASARMDFRPTDNAHFYLSHNYSRFEDAEFRDSLVIEYDRYEAGANAITGISGRTTFEKEMRNRTVVNRINTTQFGGRHFLDTLTIDYSAAYTRASQNYPDRDYLLYRETSRPRMAYDYSNPDLPTFQVLDGDNNVVRTDFNFPLEDFRWRRYERRFGDAEDKEQAYALNFTMPGEWGNAYSTFKFGAKMRLREKFNDEDRSRNSVGTGAPAFTDVIIDRNSVPFGGFYNNGPKMIRNFVDVYGSLFENEDFRPRVAASITGDYQASEDTYAAYAMNTLAWQDTTLVFGVRVEHTKITGSAFEFDEDTEESSPLSASSDYTKVFPSVHLRHELNNGVILRAAYSTALSRPNFEDMAPYVIVEDRETGAGSVDIGNTDLQPTFAHNFDFMAEYYIEPLGLISGGVFYKDLSDPIFKARSTFVGGEFDGFRMVRPENAKSGELYGFEFNWQQSLANLPGAWSGLGFLANFTYTESSADLPFGIGKTDLAGTSKNTYNLGLSYDSERVSAQLAYNYRSEFIDSYDTANPNLNVYWDGRGTMDFTLSYKLNNMFTMFMEASNLTDTKAVRYQGDRSRVFEHEQFGRAWQVGVRANF
ncbi:TonB-dependent receptor [Aliidiomarina sp.]|uniref:TonB-dependent receptor n=1 Tax=Aliidiomarina sp. TaxID=1872439 RepID=UPI003A4D84AD